jgi:uncharacterized protein YkwD
LQGSTSAVTPSSSVDTLNDNHGSYPLSYDNQGILRQNHKYSSAAIWITGLIPPFIETVNSYKEAPPFIELRIKSICICFLEESQKSPKQNRIPKNTSNSLFKMRSSTILLALGATLAVASPVHQALHQKKDLVSVTDIVTDIVYVTVTEDPNAPPESTTLVMAYNTVFVQPVAAATTSSTPPPSTSTTVPPAESTTVVIPPPPPPPAPTTSTEAAPVVVPSPAPVVEAPTTTAAAAVASPTDYISTALYHHNVHRANHSAPDVTWSDTLAGYAAITAQKCVFAHDM